MTKKQEFCLQVFDEGVKDLPANASFSEYMAVAKAALQEWNAY
jgi:hypothetical protein